MKVVVVGAGVAGVSTVGALVQQGYTNITWIDPEFQAGAMSIYDGIPGNTKAKNLEKYAKHLNIFHKYNDPQVTVNVFDKFQPEKETMLNDLKMCLDRMTNILRTDFKHQVRLIKTQMTRVVQRAQNQFEIHLKDVQKNIINADLVFLCLGGELKNVANNPNISRLNTFDIMSIKKIENYNLSNDVVEVHGSSHSAVLCLRNLTIMKNPPKKIYHIMNRRKLVYAQYIGEYIRHDTTGLKGVANEFGKQYQNGDYVDFIVPQFVWQDISNEDSTKMVEAIGFKPKEFEFVSKQGIRQYSTSEGRVYVKECKIESLFVIGLMSPKYVIDEEGERMPGVGADNFIQHIFQVIYQLKQSVQSLKCL